jgi:hypothetical protein
MDVWLWLFSLLSVYVAKTKAAVSLVLSNKMEFLKCHASVHLRFEHIDAAGKTLLTAVDRFES